MDKASRKVRFISILTIVVISVLSLITCGGGSSNSGGSTPQNPTPQQTATPTFSVAAGTYNSDQSVTISSATAGAIIYYTTDGSTPTSASTRYASAVAVSSSTTLKAFATASGYTDSTVASATYTLTVATPSISPTSGTYPGAQTVTISDATPGASIHYTIDGSTPTASSTTYAGAITVSSSATVQAIATKSGYTDSAVATATYTLKVATPSISPTAGTYPGAQTVTISDATPGASIHYTTDGSTPTASSTTYAGAITVSSNATVKAIATKSGYSDSDVASNAYMIGGGVPSYTWNTVKIIGGGYVTGINFHPTQPNLVYARTDVGGAYRWDNTNQIWVSITDWIGYDDSAALGIEAIGLDPSDPQRLYLAGGIYSRDWQGTPINGKMLVSTDQGNTFQVVSTSIPMGGNEDGRGSGNRFAVDPNYGQKLYYGSKNTGLWTSNDHGSTWSKVTSFPVTGATNGNGIPFVEFVKSSGSSGNPTPVIYAGVADNTGTYSRLYRSTNAGSTWTAVPNQPSLASLLPNHGVFGPDGSLYMSFADSIGPSGASTGAVWKYTPTSGDPNGAGTWTNITPPHLSYDWYGQQHVPAWGSVAVDPQRPGVVMASTLDLYWQHDGFARSTDGGQTWIDLGATAVRDNSLAPYMGADSPGNWINLAIDPFNSDHVLYGTGGGIWASNDVTASEPGTPNGANQALQGGITHWTIGANGLEEGCTLKLISPSAGPHLVSGMGDFVGFVHSDLTQSPAVTEPTRWANTSGLDFAESAPSVIVRVVNRGTAPWGTYTTDGGTTWTGFASSPTGSAGGTIAVSADGATFVWSAEVTDSQSNVTDGRVAYSRDHGTTWITSTGAPVTKPVYSDRVNPNKFYIMDVSTTTLYRSTDGGVTFTAVNNALPTSNWYWPTLMVSYAAEGDLWLVSDTGLYHSTDSGASFTKVSSVQAAYGIGFGKAAPGASYPAIYLSGKVNDKSAIYRSVDEGLTWVRINDDQHQYGGPTAIIGDPRIFGRVYFGAAGRGIIYGDSAY